MRDPIEVYIEGEGIVYSGNSLSYAEILRHREKSARIFQHGHEIKEEYIGPPSTETFCLTLEDLDAEMAEDTLTDTPAFLPEDADTLTF